MPLSQSPESNSASDDKALVSIQGVTFGYDSRIILTDVSLEFTRGKVVAIMGSSGCGKTTLPVSYTHLTLPTTPYV